MLRRPSPLLTCLIAGGLATWAAAPAFAQSQDFEGIIRISDTVNPAENGRGSLQPVPEGQYVDSYGADCPSCPGGRARHHGNRHQYDPGNRFSPPVKRPIYRQGVAYYKNFPDSWTGAANPQPVPNYQYPTVYMPTDTTQLGYYYQHVPYWQPREGMVPAPPIPRQWHTRVIDSEFTGRHPAGKIFGTAPTASPISPTPAPINTQQPSIQSDIPAVPVQPSVIQPSAGLEPIQGTPSLIPIN